MYPDNYGNRTMADELRENPRPVDTTPHIHFHSHYPHGRHTHEHAHPDKSGHAHSSLTVSPPK